MTSSDQLQQQIKSQSSGKRRFLQDIPKNEEHELQNEAFKEIDDLILEEERIERLSLSTPSLPHHPSYNHPSSTSTTTSSGNPFGSGKLLFQSNNNASSMSSFPNTANIINDNSSTISSNGIISSGYSSASTSNVISASNSDMDDDDDVPLSHKATVYRARSNTHNNGKHSGLNHLTPQQQQSLSMSSIQQPPTKSASHSFLPSFLPSLTKHLQSLSSSSSTTTTNSANTSMNSFYIDGQQVGNTNNNNSTTPNGSQSGYNYSNSTSTNNSNGSYNQYNNSNGSYDQYNNNINGNNGGNNSNGIYNQLQQQQVTTPTQQQLQQQSMDIKMNHMSKDDSSSFIDSNSSSTLKVAGNSRLYNTTMANNNNTDDADDDNDDDDDDTTNDGGTISNTNSNSNSYVYSPHSSIQSSMRSSFSSGGASGTINTSMGSNTSMSINNLVNAESSIPIRDPGFSPTPSPHSSTQFSPQSSTQFSLQFSAINLNHTSSGSLSNIINSPFNSSRQSASTLNKLLNGWVWVKNKQSIVIVGPSNIGKSFLLNTILRTSFIPSISNKKPILASHRPLYQQQPSQQSSQPSQPPQSQQQLTTEQSNYYLLNKLKNHLSQSSGNIPQKIDQRYQLDEAFFNSMNWNKEKELEMESIYRMSQYIHNKTASMNDTQSFLLPQGRLGCAQHYRISYGPICELLVEFMTESDVRSILWELHTHEAEKSVSIHPRRLEYLIWMYTSIVEGSVVQPQQQGQQQQQQQQGGISNRVNLINVKNSWDLPIVENVRVLLGKTFQFKGIGKNHQLDRIYIREKLKEVLACYGFIVGGFHIKIPSSILLGRREITLLSDDTRRGSVTKFTITRAIDDADQILLAFDYRGMSTDTADILISSKFINKLTMESSVYFVELGEQYQNKTPYPKGIYNSKGLIIHQLKKLYRNSRNVNFDLILDHFKLIQLMPLLFSSVELNKTLPNEYINNGYTTLNQVREQTNIPQLIKILQQSNQPSWNTQHLLFDKFKQANNYNNLKTSTTPPLQGGAAAKDQSMSPIQLSQNDKVNPQSADQSSIANSIDSNNNNITEIVIDEDDDNINDGNGTSGSASGESKMMVDEEYKLSNSFRDILHVNGTIVATPSNGGGPASSSNTTPNSASNSTNNLNLLANVVAKAIPLVDLTQTGSNSTHSSNSNSASSSLSTTPVSRFNSNNWRNQYAQYRTIAAQQQQPATTAPQAQQNTQQQLLQQQQLQLQQQQQLQQQLQSPNPNLSNVIGMERISNLFRSKFALWKRTLLALVSSESSESIFLTKVTESQVCAKLEWDRFKSASPDTITTITELCSNIYTMRNQMNISKDGLTNYDSYFSADATYYNPVLLLCKPLISWTPSFWRESIVDKMPQLEEETISFSRGLLTDISKLLINKIPMSTEERTQLIKLLQYCQSATDRNIRNKMASVKTYLNQNMTALIYSLCVETLCQELTLKVKDTKAMMHYHQILEECFHSVPLMSSSRIQQKLLEILKFVVSALDSIEKHLEHTIQYLLNSPFRLKRQAQEQQQQQIQQQDTPTSPLSSSNNTNNILINLSGSIIENYVNLVSENRNNIRSPLKQAQQLYNNNGMMVNGGNGNISYVDGMIVVKQPLQSMTPSNNNKYQTPLKHATPSSIMSPMSPTTPMSPLSPSTPSSSTSVQNKNSYSGGYHSYHNSIADYKSIIIDVDNDSQKYNSIVYSRNNINNLYNQFANSSSTTSSSSSSTTTPISTSLTSSTTTATTTTPTPNITNLTTIQPVTVPPQTHPTTPVVVTSSSSTTNSEKNDRMDVDDHIGGPLKRIKQDTPTFTEQQPQYHHHQSPQQQRQQNVLTPPQTPSTLLQLCIARVCQQIDSLSTICQANLREELLQKIITFLINQASVKGGNPNPRFGQLDDHTLTKLVNPAIMTTLELDNAKLLNGSFLRFIGSSCNVLTKLSLAHCTGITSESFQVIGNACKRSLEVLVLRGCFQLHNNAILSFLRGCNNLTNVDLSGCIKLTDSSVHELHQNNRRLQSLELRKCAQITDAAFQSYNISTLTNLDLLECGFITDHSIVNICNNSKSLSCIRLSGKGITDHSLRRLASKCRQHLTQIDLVMCDSITDNGIRTLLASCVLLNHVNFCSSKNISTNAFHFDDDSIDRQITQFQQQHNSINNSQDNVVMVIDDDVNSTTTTNTTTTGTNLTLSTTSINSLKNLTYLDLNRCILVNDSTVLSLTAHATQLETISLAWCEDVTDESVLAISQRCHQLKNIDLTKCKHITDTSIIELAKQKNLTRLVLFSCTQVSDRSIVEVATRCHSLIHLDLSQCEKVSDASLVKIAQGLPLLRVLCMEECAITDTGVSALGAIAQGYGCQYLEVVKFGYCRFLSDAALERLAVGCPMVANLDLSYCSNLITPHGLRRVIGAWSKRLHTLRLRGYISLTNENLTQDLVLEKLKTLNVSWCSNIEDGCLVQFTKNCPILENIDLSRCPKITDAAIESVIDNCPSVRLVNVSGCKDISNFTIQKLTSLGKSIYR